MMRSTSRCFALLIAILSYVSPLPAQPQTKPDASTILNNMFKAYARFTSYQEEGLLVTTIDEPTGGRIEKMPFKTFFKRPDQFRFEWIDYGIGKVGRTKMIWFNGKEAFSYWEPDVYEKEKSFDLAVAGATGISRGVVNTVSDMLLPDELGGSLLKNLTKLSLAGEEVFEGVPCYRIKATDKDEEVELWIGKNDFLLRKYRQERKLDDELWIEEEIHRKIQVDQSIPEIVFNYKPPIALTPQKEVDSAEMNEWLNPGPVAWTEFRSDEGRFSLLMPTKPISRASSVETAQGRFDQHAFIAAHPKLICMASYTDIPKNLLARNAGDEFFDGVRDQFIKEIDGKLSSETRISLDGYGGREIRVHVFRSEVRLRIFLVGDRMYSLSLFSTEKVDEETFNKFFASFKLSAIAKPIASLGRYALLPHSLNP